MSIPFIDIKAQHHALKSEIEARIQKVLEHCQFILGPEVTELETALAKYCGVKHAITCASGTDAQLLAMMAKEIGPGDEVIVPSFSFMATAETVVLLGATPVYVDVDEDTFCLDVSQLDQALSSKTKAIQPVSLYGQVADMDAINAFAKKHGLFVLEDAAQSFGGTYKGKKSGALSEVGATSFFPAKPLGCYGDGGAVFTDDDALAERIKQLRVHGQTGRYEHTYVGINGRMDTLQCAIMLPKLERFPWELEQREKIAQRYHQSFEGLKDKGVFIPLVKKDCTSAWAQYTLRTAHRDQMVKDLGAQGIPTSIHYPKAMSEQPAYLKNGRIVQDSVSRRLGKEVFSLPMYPDMPFEIQDKVIHAVLKAAEKL
jgi:UDP-2-acetamido-2-deoxy-ribo-hexuluronate aminotransferase